MRTMGQVDKATAKGPERGLLRDEIATRLRGMIIEGELLPGTRLTEKALCKRFGVSRTPLREALKVLGSEGLLELSPHRGATVVKLTKKDVDEVFSVMGALEALAGELACERISEHEIAEIKALHYQMVLAHERRQLPTYFSLNQQIHESVLMAARNETLTSQYNSLAGRIRHCRYVANMSRRRWDQAVAEHEAMLEALIARQGVRLARILKEHLKNKAEVVKAMLDVEVEDESDERRALPPAASG